MYKFNNVGNKEGLPKKYVKLKKCKCHIILALLLHIYKCSIQEKEFVFNVSDVYWFFFSFCIVYDTVQYIFFYW